MISLVPLNQKERSDQVVYGQSELESRADTIALGQNSIITGYTGRECEVSPYTDKYESIKKLAIVTG